MCFAVASAFAQNSKRLKTITIKSEVLNQERTLKVYLPLDYAEEEVYPVIYITDAGTSNFEAAKSYLDVLTTPIYDAVPKSILVGISHHNRNADLDVFQTESGEKFKRHLFNEVIPALDSRYNTSGFNVMAGHSNGAEFNHFLFLDEKNPFRGFISMSTNFNTDVRDDVKSAMAAYDGKPMYYFVANGKRDHPMRIDAGEDMKTIYEASSNSNINFQMKNYSADHQSIVAHSLLDGLTFMFSDYNAVEQYSTIIGYGENYLNDLSVSYGITGDYDMDHIDPFFMDIVMNKKLDEYHYMVDLINEHKLFMGSVLDPVNRANHYFIMGMMDKTIEYWNKAVTEVEKVDAQVFYGNLPRAIEAFTQENRLIEAVEFLEKSKELLPEEYTLLMNFHIARFSLENQVSVEKGMQALEYCEDNYRENRVFDKEDLSALGFRIDSK